MEVTAIINNIDNRVVVTGIGMLCPLGLDTATTWANLMAGKSGIGPITLFDASNHETKFCGEVRGFDPVNYIDRKEARRMDRFAQLAVAAAIQAVKASGLQISPSNQDNIGVIVGSGIGGLTTLFEQTKTLL
ncbi:MAG: beta-ketoacyl synthase N-terminal-like domain-containing protein, partial [Dehalococcoidales bacterium]|nr:beta-ketoacyl synthase N-terminal-like domain-containing protein [Dehalococcoidales bacterium]